MQGWSKLKKAAVISAVGIFGIIGLGSMSSSQKNKATQSNPENNTAVQSAQTEAQPLVAETPAPEPTPVVQVAPAPQRAPTPAPQPKNNCDPNYSGACVPIASDVDCAGGSGNGPAYVTGPVNVIGSDIYGLDGNDNDGIGCE